MLFSSNGKPNITLLRTHFHRQGKLSVEAARVLVSQATKLFAAEPNVLELSVPLMVCGDLHGQFYDLLTLFDLTTDAEQYLFLGDYVNRGDFSCEVLFYLLSLKVVNPKRLQMLRGNHETRMMANLNFYAECAFPLPFAFFSSPLTLISLHRQLQIWQRRVVQ
jgi:serine/threonine-protein phosphatase 2B catalytic subunit